MKAVEEEVKKIDSYYHQLKYLDVIVRFSSNVVANQRSASPGRRDPGDYRIYTERGRAGADPGSEAAQGVGEIDGK